MAKLKDTEEHIIQATSLGNLLINDRELFSTIHQLLNDYVTAKESCFDLFTQRADDALFECKDTLHALVNGYMITEPASKFAIGKKGAEIAQKTIKAISYEPLELWTSPNWQQAIQANADAVKRGVQIIRVFVQDSDNISRFENVLKSHVELGANVYITAPQVLSPPFLESFFILDDCIFAEFYLTLDGKLKEERISINPVEVDKAISRFNSILRQAQKYE